MATTKLKLYNGALRVLGEDKLSALTDSTEGRRLLDDVFDDGGINYLLEQGYWNFAMRTSKLEYAPSITPAFGHPRAFEKPSDWVHLAAISADEFLSIPLLDYLDEGGYIFTGLDEIYVRYVSNHSSYGTDYSLWPETFTRYAQHWFASQICERLTQSSTKLEKLIGTDGRGGLVRTLRTDARSKDAMKDPTRFLPPGNFVQSRSGGRSRDDRGRRGRLIG